METKRIQLRGISRSPSDRLTEDGGVAESLNVHLDNQEIAPVIQPVSVEGLIDKDEKRIPVYIHASSHYRNIILFDKDNNRIYHGDKLLIQLSSGSEFKDAASIGNMLYIAAGADSGYFLFKDGEYTVLGSKIPFPTLKLQGDGATFTGSFIAYDEWTQTQANQDLMFYKNVWNRYDGEGNNTLKVAADIAQSLNAVIEDLSASNYYINPIVARYAIRLYNGSVVTSVPFLIAPNSIGGFSSITGTFSHVQTENPADPEPVDAYSSEGVTEETPGDGTTDDGTTDDGTTDDGTTDDGTTDDSVTVPEWKPWYKETIEVDYSCYRYRLKATLMDFADDILEAWKDIITDIEIYISENIAVENTSSLKVTSSTQGDGEAEAEFMLGGNWDKESAITSKGVFYRIASYSLSVKEDMDKLRAGITFAMPSLDALAVMDRLDPMEDVMEGDTYLPQTVSAFNNRLIGANMAVEMGRGPRFYASSLPGSNTRKYYFRFFVSNKNGSEAQALAHDYHGREYFSDADSIPYGWIAHPNVNCSKVQICTDANYYIEVSMKPHPTLNCSYAYLGNSDLFSYLNYKSGSTSSVTGKEESPYYTEDGKILLSEIDNPMIFPIGNRYSFSGSVIGIAIATTALSQGQFGQFPLYVFSDDGIWVMQTSDEGTFVTSKPLSRDVCINARSITPIDQSVVFVSAKGVMLLTGSQIAELSPHMNGRHYSIEAPAMTIIKGMEGYKGFSEALSDNTTFMSFIKEASCAYDYAGRRLVFVKPDEEYQYVYKLDSSTWHKIMHSGLTGLRVLNSYPDCLVSGTASVTAIQMSVKEEATALDKYDVLAIINKYLPDVTLEEADHFLSKDDVINVTSLTDEEMAALERELDYNNISVTFSETQTEESRVFNLSTPLDSSLVQKTEKSIVATRPFDLGEPDVFKSVKEIKVRGNFGNKAVKYILMGSNDGVNFYSLNTLGGKSWKLFRLIVLADLGATDRISWIDVGYERRFTNKLR